MALPEHKGPREDDLELPLPDLGEDRGFDFPLDSLEDLPTKEKVAGEPETYELRNDSETYELEVSPPAQETPAARLPWLDCDESASAEVPPSKGESTKGVPGWKLRPAIIAPLALAAGVGLTIWGLSGSGEKGDAAPENNAPVKAPIIPEPKIEDARKPQIKEAEAIEPNLLTKEVIDTEMKKISDRLINNKLDTEQLGKIAEFPQDKRDALFNTFLPDNRGIAQAFYASSLLKTPTPYRDITRQQYIDLLSTLKTGQVPDSSAPIPLKVFSERLAEFQDK